MVGKAKAKAPPAQPQNMGEAVTTEHLNETKCLHCIMRGIACITGAKERCLPCSKSHLGCDFCEYIRTFNIFLLSLMNFSASAKRKAPAAAGAGCVTSRRADTLTAAQGMGKMRAEQEELTTDEASESEEDEVQIVAAPKAMMKKKIVFCNFKGLPSRAAVLAAPSPEVSKLEAEVAWLGAGNARLRGEGEDVVRMRKELARLQSENSQLRELNNRYRVFCLDTRQHARSQHAELLTVSNKFYNFSMEWSNMEKDMTEFLAQEEHTVE
jgi:hypothetical protein